MVRYLLGLSRCARGKHERCAQRAREVSETYVSRCVYCRVPMRRLRKREWIVDRDVRELV